MVNKNINHKLIPYFLPLTVLFTGVFAILQSFAESIVDVWNIPEYGMFIIINFLLSLVCTVMLFIGVLSNKVFIKILVTCVAILLLFDIYIMLKQVFLGLDVKLLTSVFFFVPLVHAYLIYMIVRESIILPENRTGG